jgi:hypothetical protein
MFLLVILHTHYKMFVNRNDPQTLFTIFDADCEYTLIFLQELIQTK